jgi:hypothetical protein
MFSYADFVIECVIAGMAAAAPLSTESERDTLSLAFSVCDVSRMSCSTCTFSHFCRRVYVRKGVYHCEMVIDRSMRDLLFYANCRGGSDYKVVSDLRAMTF